MSQEGINATASTVAAIRGQQQVRRRDGNPAAPSLADLRNNRASATPQSPARSRVQQAPASGTPDAPTGSAAAGSQSNSRSLRNRLMPLAQTVPGNPPAEAAAVATPSRTAAGFSAQLFSVFTNPLSSAGNNDTNSTKPAQHGRSRAAAALNTADDASAQPSGTQAVGAADGGQQTDDTVTAPAVLANPAGQQVGADSRTDTAKMGPVNSDPRSKPADKQSQQQQSGVQQRTYCFEVQTADTEPEQLIDYNGYDQHSEHVVGPDGQLQQLGGSIQQYVYDEDTGQLCRTGEGAETTRLGRHYLEDCHTGEFFQLAQQPASGWWAWMRRRPHLGADGWFRSAGDQQQQEQQQQQEPGLLHSLSDFLDSMGSVMAALGLFSQGLAGGLALLCLFMTYIQYATAGREGFLAFYSPQAEMINRTFFTLISISLVAAAARHAYDQLGNFSPRHLRLGVVDSLVMLLCFLAYTCNLLATPLDNQLAFEARRDPGFYLLPLPAPFEGRLSLWHALNLVRVIACGLAWVLVCYRSNHFVMLRVFEARSAQQADKCFARQQAAGTGGVVGGHGTGPADADRRRLRSMGSSAGARAATAGGIQQQHLQQQQQPWAVPSQRFGSCGVGSCPGAGNAVSNNS